MKLEVLIGRKFKYPNTPVLHLLILLEHVRLSAFDRHRIIEYWLFTYRTPLMTDLITLPVL